MFNKFPQTWGSIIFVNTHFDNTKNVTMYRASKLLDYCHIFSMEQPVLWTTEKILDKTVVATEKNVTGK